MQSAQLIINQWIINACVLGYIQARISHLESVMYLAVVSSFTKCQQITSHTVTLLLQFCAGHNQSVSILRSH